MVFIRNGEIVEADQPAVLGRPTSTGPPASDRSRFPGADHQSERQPIRSTTAASGPRSATARYGAANSSTEQLLLAPGLTDEEGVVVGTPIEQAPMGTAIGFRRGAVVDDFDDWDDLEQHTRCAVLCCGTCCPCCLGDPCTATWRRNISASWLQSFCGVVASLQVIVFMVECGLAANGHNLTKWLNIEGEVLEDLGAKDPAKIVHHFQLWRLMAAVMLHSGFVHLVWNLFAQMTSCWLFETGLGLLNDYRSGAHDNDPDHEEVELHRVGEGWGFRRTAIIYWSSGVTGGLLGCCLAPHRVCVGASGALMGLFGARAAEILSRWDSREDVADLSGQKTDLCGLVFQVCLLAAFGMGDSKVDNWANAGGFLTGVAMGCFYFFGDQVKVVDPTMRTVFQRAFPGLCLACVLGFSGVSAYFLFTNVAIPAQNHLT